MCASPRALKRPLRGKDKNYRRLDILARAAMARYRLARSPHSEVPLIRFRASVPGILPVSHTVQTTNTTTGTDKGQEKKKINMLFRCPLWLCRHPALPCTPHGDPPLHMHLFRKFKHGGGGWTVMPTIGHWPHRLSSPDPWLSCFYVWMAQT